MNFSSSKNGYNKKEVDLYILDLQGHIAELENKNRTLEQKLERYLGKDKEIDDKNRSISIALTAAVEKARQIERSSKNVYKLKIQQLGILYEKWEKLLSIILEKYPQIEEIENVNKLLAEFKDNIKSTLKEDYKLYSITTPVRNDSDTIKSLLNKLNSYTKNGSTRVVKVERKQLPKDMLTSQTELSRIEDKAPLIKPIYESDNMSKGEFENLADKFLSEDSEPNNAYANIITSKVRAVPDVNESGFDLKEAINPKEDLDEIMQAFDFYHGDDNNE